MRAFDDFEKGILRKLKLYYESGILQNYISLLDDQFENKEIVINKTHNIVTIGFDYDKYMPSSSNGAHTISDEVNNISIILIRTIFLLKYLEENGYVFLFHESKQSTSPNKHSRITSSKIPISHEIADKNVCEIIINYFTKTILISQAILELVNDNFISKEEIRHNENIKISNDNLYEAKISVKLAEKSIESAKEGLYLSQRSIKISEENLSEVQRSIKISEDNLVEAKKDVNTSRFGVAIAIIVGISSLILSTIGIVHSNKISNKPLTIDSLQYSDIKRRIDLLINQQMKINSQIDSLTFKLDPINMKLDNISDKFNRINSIKPNR
jgi:hypothetical protein